MVQHSHFFFELLQEALDFNDFGERKWGEITAPPNSPFLSQVSECLAAFLCLFDFLNIKMRFSNFTSNELQLPTPCNVFTLSTFKTLHQPR